MTVSRLLSLRNSFQLTDRVWIILLNTSLMQVWRSSPTSSESSSPWAPGRSCRRNSRSVFLRNARSRRWGPGAHFPAKPRRGAYPRLCSTNFASPKGDCPSFLAVNLRSFSYHLNELNIILQDVPENNDYFHTKDWLARLLCLSKYFICLISLSTAVQ